jgi:hypothetical protein
VAEKAADGPHFPYKIVFEAFAAEASAHAIELGHPGEGGKDEWVRSISYCAYCIFPQV